MIPKNKIGADKILSIYWFAILFIIAAGILAMVYVFYNQPFDVREIEAEILSAKTASCISEQGILDSKWLEGSENLEAFSNVADYANKNAVNGKICNCGTECNDYANYISTYASENEIDPTLLFSVMMQESLCQKTLCSDSSCGLMQIRSDEKGHCGKYDLPKDLEECRKILIEDPEKNIEIGAKILKESYNAYEDGRTFVEACSTEYQTKFYSGWDAALRGYNGWGCAPNHDTYVDDVNGIYNVLKDLFGDIEPQTANLENECNLEFSSEFDEEQFYVQVDFYDFEKFQYENRDGKKIITSKPLKNPIYDGNQNLKADCEVQNVDDFEKQAKCVEESFYSVDENNKPYIITIKTAVRKTEKNAKI